MDAHLASYHYPLMPEQVNRRPADLAAELMTADKSSRPVAEEPVPVGQASDPLGLLLYPLLRRNRKLLLPIILIAAAGLLLLSILT